MKGCSTIFTGPFPRCFLISFSGLLLLSSSQLVQSLKLWHSLQLAARILKMSLPRDEMAMLRVADYVAVIGIDWSDRNICHIKDPGSNAAIRELREHERVPMACIDRSPAIDHEGFPFPSNLAMFAFPNGSTVAIQGSCVAARLTSFILSARNEFDKVALPLNE